MTDTTAKCEAAGARNDRNALVHLVHRIPAKLRWIVPAALGLAAPLAWVAESVAEPVAEAMQCVGNGNIMALAAAANALTLMH